jgi:phosphate acetyltransferase
MSIDRSPFLNARPVVCPPDLLRRAQNLPVPRIAIARAGAALPMQAAHDATMTGIMTPVFIGERPDIEAQAEKLAWDISAYDILETRGEEAAGVMAAQACGEGRADVLMKGHLHTDIFLKSALSQKAGLRTGRRLVHIFHISHPDGGRPILVSDAAVNVAPDLETLRSALSGVVSLLHNLGNARPRVAILSATETPIASVPSSVIARDLRDWGREHLKSADFSGPLALDLILSPEAVAIKGVQADPVAGQADAIIVPDIVSGNALFKALTHLSAGCAAGIVLGAKTPILLTSRADPPAARLASVALAAIVSAAK